MDKVSIIIPAYNAEDTIARCLNSVINQNHKNIEVIIVNDGSTDNTLTICKEFEKNDKRLVIINQKNSGVSRARNVALKKISGSFVCFVDSDDFIDESMVEIMLKKLLEEGADIVECSYYVTNGKEIINKYTFKDEIIEDKQIYFERTVQRKNSINAIWNKLYRSSLFNDINFPMFNFSEDFSLNTQMSLILNKKITISNCLYFYYYNHSGASFSPYKSQKIDHIKANLDILEKFKGMHKNYSLELLNESIVKSCIRVYSNLLKTKPLGFYEDKTYIKRILRENYKFNSNNGFKTKDLIRIFMILYFSRIYELSYFIRNNVKKRS